MTKPKIRKAPAGYCNDCFVPGNGVTVTLCEYHASVEEMRAMLHRLLTAPKGEIPWVEARALLARVDKVAVYHDASTAHRIGGPISCPLCTTDPKKVGQPYQAGRVIS